MKKMYVDTPEGQIHCLIEGSGEPIILLHQSPLSADSFRDVIPILSPKYRAIAVDAPGFGNSDKPVKKPQIADYARSIIYLLDALSINKANIVGHHTGANIAIEVAATKQERVNKLVLSGVHLLTAEQREVLLKGALFPPFNITEDGAFLGHLWGYLRDYFSSGTTAKSPLKGNALKQKPALKPEVVYRIFLDMLLAGPRFKEAGLASFSYDVAAKLSLIKVPTLLMTGDMDAAFTNVGAVKALIPHCQVKIIHDSADAVNYEKAEEYGQAINTFFTDNAMIC